MPFGAEKTMRSKVMGKAVLLAVCLATSVTARAPRHIFERASTCPDSAYLGCSISGLPSNFCCPSGSNCIALAGLTTVLCCPTGETCQTIKPITCDITSQNVTLHPDNTLKTTALGATLPTCAGQCCPFGYTCNSAGNCVMNSDQSVAPAGSSSSSTSAYPTSTSTSTSASASASSTTTSSPSQNTTVSNPLPQATCNNFPITAILTGLFPGIVLGLLLAFLGICLYGKRAKSHAQQAQAQNSQLRRRSGSSFGNISEPQPLDSDMRSDFLRKAPMTPSSTAGSTPGRRNTIHRKVTSLFRKSRGAGQNGGVNQWSPGLAPPVPLNIRKGPDVRLEERPVTPPNQIGREESAFFQEIPLRFDDETEGSMRERSPSNENGGSGGLRVEIQRAGERQSYMTTVSDMMERSGGLAGLPKGQPFPYKGTTYTSPPR